ncbi:CMRF35-like molecule 9 isoform X7 [Equus asinus]
MRPLVLLWGCLVLPGYGVLVGPKEISGFEGDTLSLQCTYGEELRKHKKYWCREGGLLISRCSGTIYAEEDGQERTAGRVSVWDSPKELTLTVTLRNLTLQDAGKYWCGVSRLGFDWSFLVSLRVLPGPCCLPSPTPSFQPLATRSLQPKAKTWQTQPPELTSPGLHPTVTTAKQKTGAEASPFTGTSASRHTQASLYAGPAPYTGTSPHAVTSPFTGTPPHEATSPHAGTSRPATQLDSTSAETSLVPSSRSSKSRALESGTAYTQGPVAPLLDTQAHHGEGSTAAAVPTSLPASASETATQFSSFRLSTLHWTWCQAYVGPSPWSNGRT